MKPSSAVLLSVCLGLALSPVAVPPAAAQDGLEACIAAPDARCAPVLIDALTLRIDGAASESARARLAGALAATGHIEAARGLIEGRDRAAPTQADAPWHDALRQVVLGMANSTNSTPRDDILAFIAAQAADDLQHDALLLTLIRQVLDAGHPVQAASLIEAMRTPPDRTIATIHVAAALVQQGRDDTGEARFQSAVRTLAQMPDPQTRREVFGFLADAAIGVGRWDIAVEAVPSVGTFPLDQADTLATILHAGAGRLDPAAWRPLAEAAADLIASSDASTADALDRRDWGWTHLATGVARSGDVPMAVTLAGRIQAEGLRDRQIEAIMRQGIADGRFGDARAILPTLPDWDAQALGYIELAHNALARGLDADARQAYADVLALAEGPEWVPLEPATLARLAVLEGAFGAQDIARLRLRFIGNATARTDALITLAGQAAQDALSYPEALAAARRAVLDASDRDRRHRDLAALARTLVGAGRAQDALDLAAHVDPDAARNRFFAQTVTALVANGALDPAWQAAQAILAPSDRTGSELEVLIAALLATDGA